MVMLQTDGCRFGEQAWMRSKLTSLRESCQSASQKSQNAKKRQLQHGKVPLTNLFPETTAEVVGLSVVPWTIRSTLEKHSIHQEMNAFRLTSCSL